MDAHVATMSGFLCPKCTHESQIFKATTGGVQQLCKDMNIPFLGAVPPDPRIGMACGFGQSFMDSFAIAERAEACQPSPTSYFCSPLREGHPSVSCDPLLACHQYATLST